MISRADACCTLLQQVMACADLESMMPADMQERILAETGTQHESGWRKNYFMPAQADRYDLLNWPEHLVHLQLTGLC